MKRRAIKLGHYTQWLVVILAILAAGGCHVGPRYARPSVPVPPAYKEEAAAQPAAATQKLPDKWWEIFGDPQLSAMEAQIGVSNQNLKQAEARYRLARALVRYFRADLYPTGSAKASIAPQHLPKNRPPQSALSGITFTDYLLAGDLSYEVDAWNRIHQTVESSVATAQADAADLATVNLSLQAELALDYFELRSLDAQKRLLDSTVKDYEEALHLTDNRFKGGLASAVDVAQARTQFETTRAQATDLGVERAQFEHAIAVLVGKPASQFSLAFSPAIAPPPPIPAGIPSQLLERRPDIAAAERRTAAANAQIGIAKTAYYPQVILTASAGLESGSLTTLIQGPSALWSAGAGALATVLDVSRRRALTEEAQAAYDQTVAAYRQSVLNAFQEVEDNLAALRILDQETKTQDLAVQSAQHTLNLSMNRYIGGLTDYLEVLTAQSTALTDERAAVDILRRRLDASVLLIKALGGGWNAATGIPLAGSIIKKTATKQP